MIRGIHHVALHTADIDRLVAFYREAFGFEPVGEPFAWSHDARIDEAIGVKGSAARTVMMRAGNCHVELFQYASPPAKGGTPLRPHDHGYTHFCVDVTDIAVEFERLKAVGMRFVCEAPADFGELKAAYGQDPDGNLIEIQEVVGDHPFALRF